MHYKSITNQPYFEGFPINIGAEGQFSCYKIILKRLDERFEYMITRHQKVLFIRFDLRFPKNNYWPDPSNDKVSRLFKILKGYYDYKKIEIQSLWAREISREKHQHYHAMLLVDGRKARFYLPVLNKVSEIWKNLLGVNNDGLVEFCNRDRDGFPCQNGIMIKRPTAMQGTAAYLDQEAEFYIALEKCFYWASYLAKVNQKSNTPQGVRKFDASRLKGWRSE